MTCHPRFTVAQTMTPLLGTHSSRWFKKVGGTKLGHAHPAPSVARARGSRLSCGRQGRPSNQFRYRTLFNTDFMKYQLWKGRRCPTHSGVLKGKPAVAADDVLDPSLNRLKARNAARLALQVVDDSSQRFEIQGAAPVRAMVQRLTVCEPLSVCSSQ